MCSAAQTDLYGMRIWRLAATPPDRSDAYMVAHITPLEAPIVWLAFAAGVAVGLVACYVWLQRSWKRG